MFPILTKFDLFFRDKAIEEDPAVSSSATCEASGDLKPRHNGNNNLRNQ